MNLENLKKEVEKIENVRAARIWKNKRLYVDLDTDPSYRGERNFKIYFGEKGWVYERGPGTTRTEFDENFKNFWAKKPTL